MAEHSQRKPTGSSTSVKSTSSWKNRSGGMGGTSRQMSSQKQVGKTVGIPAQQSSQHKNSGKYRGKPNVRKVTIS